jgi:PhnB protein
MAKKAKPIPEGYQTVTPHVVLDDCARAIDFYTKAFGAKERMRMPGPGGKIAHAEIKIGDSIVMMNDEMPSMPGQPGVYKSPKAAGFATAALFLYVKDVDAAFERAVKAGCTVRTPVTDMFWGDRWGQVIDPFGLTWGLATHKEDLTPKQMAKRQQEFMAKMQQGTRPSA